MQAFLFSEPAWYKPFGRTWLTDGALTCDYSASGVEFTGVVGGDLYLTCSCGIPGYLALFLDGEAYPRARFEAGDTRVRIFAALPEGRHTVRILRDSDLDAKGSSLLLRTLEVQSATDLTATAKKPLYLEFTGDSIVTGKGVLNGGGYQADDPRHSATHSFAYLTAQLLDADWSLAARGGIGLIRRTAYMNKTLPEIYPYRNGFAEHPVEYDFARKPDAVVVNIGTNDGGSASAEEIAAALREFIALIRKRNGCVPIILAYNAMLSTFSKVYPEVAQTEGCHALKLTRDNRGAHSGNSLIGHPCEQAARLAAEETAALLREIFQNRKEAIR